MVSAGSLSFVLSADSSQLRNELTSIKKQANTTANAITNLFANETVSAVSFTVLRSVIVGTVEDLDDLNNGLSLTESLTKNAAAGFADLGDIAILQLGEIASFLGNDIFTTPLAVFQSKALEDVGLGGLEKAYQVLTAGSNAAKILEVAVGGVSGALQGLDGIFEAVSNQAKIVSDFFTNIAKNAQLASSVLVAVVGIVDQAIDQLIDSLGETNPAFKVAKEGAKALGIEFSLGRSLLGQYIEDINRIDSAASNFANAANTITDGSENARRGIGKASESLFGFSKNLSSQQSAVSLFEGAVEDLADAGQLLSIYNQVNGIFERFTGSLEDNFNAAAKAETLSNRLELVTASAGGTAEELSYLSEVSNKLGVDFNATAEGYTQFSTAATLANLSFEDTRQVFDGVTQSASVLNLTAADTEGVFLAFRQSLSGGNVQLEELNQLAEKIPGTFQAASAALGVTSTEVKELISQGKTDSAEFLPQFAEQLRVFTDSGLEESMNSGSAAVNRFNNALGDFQVAAGKAWLDVGTPALNAFSKAIEFAAQNEELFSTAIDAILVATLPLFISSMSKATLGVIEFITANKTATINLFGQQISATAAQIGKFAAQIALAYAATIVFYRVLDRLTPTAKGTQSAIETLNRSLYELSKASESAGAIKNVLPDKPPPTDWLDTAVSKFNELIVVTNDLLGINTEAIDKNPVLRFLFGTVTTQGEKALNDQLVAISNFSAKAQDILGKSFEFRQTAEAGKGPLQTIKNIDAALTKLDDKRTKTNPNDLSAIAKIAEDEKVLLEQRSKAQKEVTANQTAITTALAKTRQELQNLDPSKLGTEGYEQAKAQIEAQIGLLEREKQQFDELTAKSKTTAASIADNFEQTSTKLDSNFANIQASIQESLASGAITQEQAQIEQIASEKQYLETRLKNNKDAATKLKAELERNAKIKATDPSKATLTADQEKEYAEQVKAIEGDIAKTRIDLAKNTLSAKEQLNAEELDSVRRNQLEAEAYIQKTENDRITAIKQRQSEGAISEGEAAKQIAAVQQQSIVSQIAAEKSKLEDIAKLRQAGVISAKDAADQERDIQTTLSNLNMQRIDADIEARKAANQQVISEFEDGLKQAEAAIARAETARKTAIAQQTLQGADPNRIGQAEIEAQRATTAATIAIKQQELSDISKLQDRGVISAKEAASRELAALQAIGDLKLQQVQTEIAAQQQVLRASQDVADQQLQQVQAAETNKIAAIKESQADRLITEQQAADQIAQINRNSADQALAIKQKELSDIRALRASGDLSIEESAVREKELIQEIGQLRQSAAEADITAQQQAAATRIASIEQQLTVEQTASEVRQGLAALEKSNLENQSNLLSAQLGLLQAQTSLRQQRLQSAISEAEQDGRSAEAESLKKQLLEEQIRAQNQQFAIERQQFELKRQQVALEQETARIQAQIAVTEAQINIQKAQANNATAIEIANLQQILGLRQKQLIALDQQAAGQAKINALEEKTLRLKQQQSSEQLKQSNQTSSNVAALSGSSGSGGSSPGSLLMGTQSGGTPSVMSITDKLTDLGRNSDLAGAFKAANLGLGLKLGFSNASQLAQSVGVGSDQLLGKLDQLIAATKESAGRPNLSISNINDLGMAGQIYSDIGRSSLRGANL